MNKQCGLYIEASWTMDRLYLDYKQVSTVEEGNKRVDDRFTQALQVQKNTQIINDGTTCLVFSREFTYMDIHVRYTMLVTYYDGGLVTTELYISAPLCDATESLTRIPYEYWPKKIQNEIFKGSYAFNKNNTNFSVFYIMNPDNGHAILMGSTRREIEDSVLTMLDNSNAKDVKIDFVGPHSTLIRFNDSDSGVRKSLVISANPFVEFKRVIYERTNTNRYKYLFNS